MSIDLLKTSLILYEINNAVDMQKIKSELHVFPIIFRSSKTAVEILYLSNKQLKTNSITRQPSASSLCEDSR